MDKPTWKDVFDCSKVFPKPFDECQEIARSVGYRYMCFNGLVYSINVRSTGDWTWKEEDLTE